MKAAVQSLIWLRFTACTLKLNGICCSYSNITLNPHDSVGNFFSTKLLLLVYSLFPSSFCHVIQHLILYTVSRKPAYMMLRHLCYLTWHPKPPQPPPNPKSRLDQITGSVYLHIQPTTHIISSALMSQVVVFMNRILPVRVPNIWNI